MTNTEMLKDVIKASGYRIDYIAEQCGLSYQGFYNKLVNKTEFTASEIATLRSLLNLDNDKSVAIFFTQKVAK